MKEKLRNGDWNKILGWGGKRLVYKSSWHSERVWLSAFLASSSARPLTSENQTRDGRRGPRRLPSTCVLRSGVWHTQRRHSADFRAYAMVESNNFSNCLYIWSAHKYIYLIQYSCILIRYYTPLEYRQTFTVTSMQLVKNIDIKSIGLLDLVNFLSFICLMKKTGYQLPL